MNDELNMDYINSLPQPFIATILGGQEFPVYDICVDIGVVRIDVCGLLQRVCMGEIRSIKDANGVVHDPETFYSDYERSI